MDCIHANSIQTHIAYGNNVGTSVGAKVLCERSRHFFSGVEAKETMEGENDTTKISTHGDNVGDSDGERVLLKRGKTNALVNGQ